MAENVTIGGGGTLFVGEDKTLSLELTSKADSTVAVNMSGWTMVFDVRKSDTSQTSILSLTPSVTGSFNALRSSNTQRAMVTISDESTNLFKGATYRYAWKRLDEDSETVLMWGDFVLEKATAP